MITKKQINRAIQSTGLEIQSTKNDGYAYFTSLETGDQIGDSVMVCFLNQLTIPEWTQAAEYCAKSIR